MRNSIIHSPCPSSFFVMHSFILSFFLSLFPTIAVMRRGDGRRDSVARILEIEPVRLIGTAGKVLDQMVILENDLDGVCSSITK